MLFQKMLLKMKNWHLQRLRKKFFNAFPRDNQGHLCEVIGKDSVCYISRRVVES